LSHFLRNREGALEESETQFYGAGKKCAIPAGRFYRGFYSSRGVMGESRQVTLTNLIAGPLALIGARPFYIIIYNFYLPQK